MSARLPAVVALVIAGIALPGCTEVESDTVEGYEPAQLEGIEGSELMRVTFTREGAARTDLRTAPVQRSGDRRVVPYAAVFYDGDGKTYVYVAEKPLSFLRAEIVVDHIEGDRALLDDGPPVGGQVVTTGAAEVHGAELEIAGSH
jgi:hypothetical protein